VKFITTHPHLVPRLKTHKQVYGVIVKNGNNLYLVILITSIMELAEFP